MTGSTPRDNPAQPPAFHLAQINVGRLVAATDDPLVADFMSALDEVNGIADSSPGFVWRFQTAEGNATGLRPFEEDLMLINFSVWQDIESLRVYTYASGHLPYLRRRREWFEPIRDHILALWWVPVGHLPTVEEAMDRLTLLRERGPSPASFTFRQSFPHPTG